MKPTGEGGDQHAITTTDHDRDSRLGADFKGNATSRRLGVIDSLGTSFNVTAHTVVVGGRVGRQIAQSVQSNGVLRSGEPESSSIASDLARRHIVGSLSTEKEAITSNNGIGREGRSLN